MDILKIIAITSNAAVLLLVIELIRRGRLKEKYSLLWLIAGSVMLLFSVSRGLLEFFSRLVGIYYAPSFLFLLAIFFLFLIALHFSVVVSGLSEKNKRLAQEIALLKQELQERLRGEESGKKAK